MTDETKKKIKVAIVSFFTGIVSALAGVCAVVLHNRKTVNNIGAEQQRITDGVADIERTSKRIANIIGENEKILSEIRNTKQDN